ISVPPYFEISTLSPDFTVKSTFLPLSSILPVPRATTLPSCGFSLAVSGIMMPPFLVSCSSIGCTSTRSPSGFTLIAIWFLLTPSAGWLLPGGRSSHRTSGYAANCCWERLISYLRRLLRTPRRPRHPGPCADPRFQAPPEARDVRRLPGPVRDRRSL